MPFLGLETQCIHSLLTAVGACIDRAISGGHIYPHRSCAQEELLRHKIHSSRYLDPSYSAPLALSILSATSSRNVKFRLQGSPWYFVYAALSTLIRNNLPFFLFLRNLRVDNNGLVGLRFLDLHVLDPFLLKKVFRMGLMKIRGLSHLLRRLCILFHLPPVFRAKFRHLCRA